MSFSKLLCFRRREREADGEIGWPWEGMGGVLSEEFDSAVKEGKEEVKTCTEVA